MGKERFLNVLLRPDEKQALRDAAEAREMTLSDFVRELLRDYVRPADPPGRRWPSDPAMRKSRQAA
jgi:hypothetical protein